MDAHTKAREGPRRGEGMNFWREVWEGYKKRFWIFYIWLLMTVLIATVLMLLAERVEP